MIQPIVPSKNRNGYYKFLGLTTGMFCFPCPVPVHACVLSSRGSTSQYHRSGRQPGHGVQLRASQRFTLCTRVACSLPVNECSLCGLTEGDSVSHCFHGSTADWKMRQQGKWEPTWSGFNNSSFWLSSLGSNAGKMLVGQMRRSWQT